MPSSKIPGELPAIFLTGWVLRFYHLDAESMWRDEISSVLVASLDLPQIIANRAADVHPPLYYLVLHYWMMLWGNSEFAVRSLSAVFGSLALWPMYRIGTLLFDERTGVLSALGFAVAEFQIYYAQEAKGYSLMVLLTLLSLISLWELLRQEGRFAAIRYVLFTSLLMYTHTYALFVVVGQNLYYFFSAGLTQWPTVQVRRWMLLQGLLLLAYLPWTGVLLHQTRTVQEGFWLKPPTFFSLIDTFAVYAGSHLSLVIFLMLLLVAWLVRMKEHTDCLQEKDHILEKLSRALTFEHGSSIAFVVSWLLTPVVLPFLLSFWMASIYLTRGTISAALAFYVMVARGIAVLSRRRALALGVIGLVLIVSLVNVTQYYKKVQKEQWREAAAYVDLYAEPQILLLFTPYFCQIPFDYYSSRQDFTKHTLAHSLAHTHSLAFPVRVWVVACAEHRVSLGETQTLLAGYTIEREQRYKGVALLSLLRKNQ